MISIFIGGINVETKDNIIIERNATDEREFGKITVYTDRRKRYEANTFVQIFIPEEEQYIVQSDQVNEVRDGRYEHVIRLQEVVARFDTVTPASRSLSTRTGETTNVQQMLNKYKRELEKYHAINIEYENGDWLENIVKEDEYDGLNFSTILKRIFENANLRANPKAYLSGNTYIIYPQYTTTRGNLITTNYESMTYQQNATDYATRIRANLKNVVNTSIPSKWFPSTLGSILARPEGILVTKSSLQYELPDDIILLEKVIAVNISYEDTTQDIIVTSDIDITDYVVTNDEWEALKDVNVFQIIETPNRRNHIRYDLEGKKIYGLHAESSGFLGYKTTTEFLKNAIFAALIDIEPVTDAYILEPVEVEDISIRIKYKAMRDMDIQVSRINVQDMISSSTFYNQSVTQIDSVSFANEMAIHVEKMGNNEIVFTKTFDENSTPYDLFDYDAEGYAIFEKKLTITNNNYIFAEYKATDNLVNMGTYGLNRSPRIYSITTKKLTTTPIENIFIVANSEEKNREGTRLTKKALDSIYSLFSGDINTEQIEYAIYRPDMQDFDISKVIHMPLEIIAENNTININAKFNKNIIAGWDIENIDGDKYKQPIIYTRNKANDFKLFDFQIYFTHGGTIVDTGSYPLVEETQSMIENAFITNELLPIDLDLNDALGYTMALHYTTEDKRIIIGPAITKYNRLVIDEAPFLNIFRSTKPYIQGMKTLRDTDVLASASYSFNEANKKLTITAPDIPSHDYLAIAVEGSREILIACNKIKEVWFDINDIQGIPFYVLFDSYTSELIITSDFEDEKIDFDIYEDSQESNLTITSDFEDESIQYDEVDDQFESNVIIDTEFMDETERPVEWVEGGSETQGDPVCEAENDIGNVRVKSTSTTGTWVAIRNGEGHPTTDPEFDEQADILVDQSLPPTSNYNHGDRIYLYSTFIDAWTLYELEVLTTTTYETCQLKV